MSDWTTPADLRAQVQRLWDKGRLPACLVEAGDVFPLRLVLKVPRSGDLSDRFDEVRAWSLALQQGAKAGYRLMMREVRHRVIGSNAVPDEAWVDTPDDALRLIGKLREARAFDQIVEHTRARQPVLLAWLQCNPLRALALADVWGRLLDVVAWIAAHPRPGIYLRQVDLGGIDSKFIEAHRVVLSELLDRVLPPQAVDTAAGGAAHFAQRYGFRSKPVRVRFRMLDPRHALAATGADGDLTVSHDGFAGLAPRVSRVFITENEVNFLAFPPLADSLLVFGAGYGFDMLARARWLGDKSIHYWGDIDTHGFAILDQLRSHFAHVASFLMDRATLFAHQAQWTEELQPTIRDLPRLSTEERALYDDLRWKRLETRPLRLEQERIGFRCIEEALAPLALAATTAAPARVPARAPKS